MVVTPRGSISAEHGIGLDKREALAVHVSAPGLDLTQRMMAWMGPHGRLNPGKVLAPAPAKGATSVDTA